MTFEGVQLQGTVKIMEKLNVSSKLLVFYCLKTIMGNQIFKNEKRLLSIQFFQYLKLH